VIFVLKIVAVEQIPPAEATPTHDDFHLLTVSDRDNVFPSTFLGKWQTTIPTKNLKWDQMRVHRMQH
jgi:hypothetical protein